MKQIDNNPCANHEQVAMLLPWYINKSLQGAELDAVERHLKVCLICKREMINLRYLAAAVNQAGSFDSAANSSFARLKNRLHAAETNANQSQPLVAAPKRYKGYGKINLERFALPGAALALAAGVVFVLLLPQFIQNDQVFINSYRTLSDADNNVASNKNELRVIFKVATSQQTIKQIVDSIQGYIIKGPDEQSLYTVGIKEPSGKTGMLDKLSLLRKDAHVVFAEPAYALLSSNHSDKTKK